QCVTIIYGSDILTVPSSFCDVCLFSLHYFFRFFFFFSSRRRHTRFSRDWSSDVCSSDLLPATAPCSPKARKPGKSMVAITCSSTDRKSVGVGKECRSRWSPYH